MYFMFAYAGYMNTIIFLEVDTEDMVKVTSVFPNAQMHAETINSTTVLQTCAQAEVISCFIYSKFTKEVLDALPNLKLLCTRSVGFDHIDTAECAKRGITVCNVPDYGSHVIAEHVFALLLSTLRHINEADDRTQQGMFSYHGLRGMALRGKTIGIFGTGKIGRRVAEIAHGFGMHIVAVDQCRTIELEEKYHVHYVSFLEAVAQSDILSLHLPALPETYHIFNKDTFAQCKPGAVLVNTARGTLISAPDLLDALNTKKLSYALLDVLEDEKNIAETASVTSHPNVVVTPHIAFYADDSMNHMYKECFQSIHDWQANIEPLHMLKIAPEVCDLPPIGTKIIQS